MKPDEERRHEQQREQRDRATEHEGAPTTAKREAGKRHEHERRDRDSAGATHELRRDPEAVIGPDLQLVRILL